MDVEDPAPLLSVAILVLYGALAVGWRSWIQRQRTGDSGLRLLPGGASEWTAGAVLGLGLALSVLAPLADLAGILPAIESLEGWGPRAVGVALAGAGIGLTIRAQLDLGESWRLGVRVGEAAPLVTYGVFARVRNPIFSGVLLTFGGLGLLVPNALAATGWVALLAGLEVQVRAVEEPHLARLHGGRYQAYAARTGRFLPSLGRLAPSRPRSEG